MAISWTHWTATITSPPNILPLGPKQLLILPKFCLPLFISFFEGINVGVHSDKTLVDLLTFKCKELILFYELACATVIQPKAGVLNLPLCHGTLWEFGENHWPFSQIAFKINYTDTYYISSITIYITVCTTQETNYAQIQCYFINLLN